MERGKLYDREKFDEFDKETIRQKTGGRCAHCGIEVWVGGKGYIDQKHLFTVDHYIPLNQGGSNVMVNLIPLCENCNKEKGDRIINPRGYLKYLDDKHKKDIIGMYDGYVKSFDYLSRNNLLQNDEYELFVPAFVAMGDVREKTGTHMKKGVVYHMYRGKQSNYDDILKFYIKYLKKYNAFDGEEYAEANIWYWLVNGCVYYVKDKAGDILGFCAVTTFSTKFSMDGDLKYFIRIHPFFYYSSTKTKLLYVQMTDWLVQRIGNENNLPYIMSETVLLKDDTILNGTRLQGTYDCDSDDSRFVTSCDRYYSDDYYDLWDSKSKKWKLPYDEVEKLEKDVSNFFDKVRSNTKVLSKILGKKIFSPYSAGYEWDYEDE